MVAAEKLQRLKAEQKVQDVEQAMKGVEELIEARRDQLHNLRECLENAEHERDEYKLQLMTIQNQRHATDPDNCSTTCIQSEYVLNSNPTLAFSPKDTTSAAVQSFILPHASNEFIVSRGACSPYTPGRSPSPFLFQQLPRAKIMDDILPFQEFLHFTRYLIRLRTDLLGRPTQQPTFSDSYSSAAAAMSGISTTSSTSDTYRHPTSSASASNKDQTTSANELFTPVLPLSQHLSQPFIKRCMDEDSDPTLRLDIAPGLNFLSRRGILSALIEGHLVIEPVWSDVGAELDKCSLCGCSLDKWFPGRASSATSISTAVNTIGSSSASSTMRKMLGGGGWTFGTLSRNKRPSISAGTFVPKPKVASQPTSSQSFKSPMPPGPASATASGCNSPTREECDVVYVHTFRAGDTASTRYPICPTYCLTRLRSVCDFWTFVRSVERGLLLDESFRFANRSSQIANGKRSSEPHSLGLAYDHTLQMMKETGKSVDSAIYPPAVTHPVVPFSKSSPDPVIHMATMVPGSQYKFNPLSYDRSYHAQPITGTPSPSSIDVSHPSPLQSEVVKHAAAAVTQCRDPTEPPLSACEAVILPAQSPSGLHSARGKAASLSTPPVPRRSAARAHSIPPKTLSASHDINQIFNPNVFALSPSAGSSVSSQAISQTLCLRGASQPQQTSQSTSMPTKPTPSRRCSIIENETSEEDSYSAIEGLDAGWEEKCWSQLIRLKEEMFYKRVGVSIIGH